MQNKREREWRKNEREWNVECRMQNRIYKQNESERERVECTEWRESQCEYSMRMNDCRMRNEIPKNE